MTKTKSVFHRTGTIASSKNHNRKKHGIQRKRLSQAQINDKKARKYISKHRRPAVIDLHPMYFAFNSKKEDA